MPILTSVLPESQADEEIPDPQASSLSVRLASRTIENPSKFCSNH
jgi:hypothetical protein